MWVPDSCYVALCVLFGPVIACCTGCVLVEQCEPHRHNPYYVAKTLTCSLYHGNAVSDGGWHTCVVHCMSCVLVYAQQAAPHQMTNTTG